MVGLESGASSPADEWMVRTHGQNELLGPFSKEKVIEMIRQGKLGPEDEVCRANHYWIYLDERAEVKAHLGIEPPQPIRSMNGENGEDEITETETDTAALLEIPSATLSDVPDLDSAPSEDASALANRALRQYQPSAASPTPGPMSQRSAPYSGHSSSPRLEKPFFLRVVFSILIVLAGVLMGWLVHLLRA